tara:strand:- start:261 stop:566 length:306 start_codon:yes stop_codon:yes gene_type:complete
MIKKTISEIQEKYDLELDKIIRTIRKQKAEKVLIQLPDGLKPYSTTIIGYLENKLSNVEFFLWLGSCFGACDVPGVDVDLIIQFGHSNWNYDENSEIKVVK